MAVCGKCGAQASDDVKFCTSCGAPMAIPQAPPVQPQQPVEQPVQPQQPAQSEIVGAVTEKFNQFNNTADSTAQYDPADIEQNKIMGLLAYLSWLVLVPIFAAKNSPYARFHANQGLVLAIAEIIWSVVYGILWRLPFLGWVVDLIGSLVYLLFAVISIIGIINAISGKAKELPIIGSFKVLK